MGRWGKGAEGRRGFGNLLKFFLLIFFFVNFFFLCLGDKYSCGEGLKHQGVGNKRSEGEELCPAFPSHFIRATSSQVLSPGREAWDARGRRTESSEGPTLSPHWRWFPFKYIHTLPRPPSPRAY